MKRLLIICAAALSFACGGTQTCNTHCDCTRTDATLRCVGEWACGSGVCEYQCRSACDTLPYTCGPNEECNGNICSVRKTC